MFKALSLGLMLLFPVTVAAQESDALATWKAVPSTVFEANEVDLSAFVWSARPLVIFADNPNDPRFIEQLSLLIEDIDDVIERDIVVIVDTDATDRSDIRNTLRPRGFMLALLGKDGDVKLRKPFPWDMRELSRVIDKMPLRQREIIEKRAANPLSE